MTAALLFLLAGQKPTAPATPSLRFKDGSFYVSQPGSDEIFGVPLKPLPEKPVQSLQFRRNQTFVVWDGRGLTVRVGKHVRSTHLPEIPVSPKIFSKEQILNTKARVKRHLRSLDASGVSGAMRMGNDVYFLARWEEPKNKPWMEALVRVDLTSPSPKPQLVGRYNGLSLADKPIDQRLFIKNAQIATVVKFGPAWGVSAYDPKRDEFGFMTIGDHLKGFALIGKLTAIYIETSSYGPAKVGRADLDTGKRQELFETRGQVRLIDHQLPPMFIVTDRDGRSLRNPQTGSEVTLGKGWSCARSPYGVVAWTPEDAPKAARLYDPARWGVLASWPSKAKPPAQVTKKPAHPHRAKTKKPLRSREGE